MHREVFKLCTVVPPAILWMATLWSRETFLPWALGASILMAAIIGIDVVRRDHLGRPGFFE